MFNKNKDKKKKEKVDVKREFNVFERIVYNFLIRVMVFTVSIVYIYSVGFLLSAFIYPLFNSVMIKSFSLNAKADDLTIISFSVIPSVIFTFWIGFVFAYLSNILYKKLAVTVNKHLIKKGDLKN